MSSQTFSSEPGIKLDRADRERMINLETIRLTPEDALSCLTSESELILPCPTVKACNNLDEYLAKSTQNTLKTGKNFKHPHTTFSSEPFAVPLVRNFSKILKKPLESFSTTLQTEPSKRIKPDLFSRIEREETSSGPISVLKRRINKVVKVLIRRRRKVPYISRVIQYKGTLILYDKHMNLYLKNVIESFKFKSNDKMVKRARHRDALLIRGDNVILIC